MRLLRRVAFAGAAVPWWLVLEVAKALLRVAEMIWTEVADDRD